MVRGGMDRSRFRREPEGDRDKAMRSPHVDRRDREIDTIGAEEGKMTIDDRNGLNRGYDDHDWKTGAEPDRKIKVLYILHSTTARGLCVSALSGYL
jgi:hypothetical protein